MYCFLWEGPTSKACTKFGCPHLRFVETSISAETGCFPLMSLQPEGELEVQSKISVPKGFEAITRTCESKRVPLPSLHDALFRGVETLFVEFDLQGQWVDLSVSKNTISSFPSISLLLYVNITCSCPIRRPLTSPSCAEGTRQTHPTPANI